MLKVSGTASAALPRISTSGKTDWQAGDGCGVIAGDDSLQAAGRGVVYEEKGKQHKGNWKSKCKLPSVLSCTQEKLHRHIHDSTDFSISLSLLWARSLLEDSENSTSLDKIYEQKT